MLSLFPIRRLDNKSLLLKHAPFVPLAIIQSVPR
ncbi:hypothetical protein CCACVL1_00597, partial [Corchorus capsularis]